MHTPLEKSHPLFPSNPPQKIKILLSPCLLENLAGSSTHLAERGIHYVKNVYDSDSNSICHQLMHPSQTI